MPKVGHLKAYLASLSAPFVTNIEDLTQKGGADRLKSFRRGRKLVGCMEKLTDSANSVGRWLIAICK